MWLMMLFPCVSSLTSLRGWLAGLLLKLSCRTALDIVGFHVKIEVPRL